jgi:hypothetical protein
VQNHPATTPGENPQARLSGCTDTTKRSLGWQQTVQHMPPGQTASLTYHSKTITRQVNITIGDWAEGARTTLTVGGSLVPPQVRASKPIMTMISLAIFGPARRLMGTIVATTCFVCPSDATGPRAGVLGVFLHPGRQLQRSRFEIKRRLLPVDPTSRGGCS